MLHIGYINCLNILHGNKVVWYDMVYLYNVLILLGLISCRRTQPNSTYDNQLFMLLECFVDFSMVRNVFYFHWETLQTFQNAMRMFSNAFQCFQMRCPEKQLNAIFIEAGFPKEGHIIL